MKAFLLFRAMIIGVTTPTTLTIWIKTRDRLKIQKVQKSQFKSGFCYRHRPGVNLGN